MTHKAITVMSLSDKGVEALKTQYKNFKKSDRRERMMGKGLGVNVEILEEDPYTIKLHFRGVTAKLLRMDHAVLEIHTQMKEAECEHGVDYKTVVEE